MCSRREADTYVDRGWVTVNGQPVACGERVPRGSDIQLHKHGERARSGLVTLALYKPKRYISQARNPRPGQKFAFELLRWENQGVAGAAGPGAGRGGGGGYNGEEPIALPKLGCCGRLDVDSTGLLVFTQDGAVARAVLEGTPKQYRVQVRDMEREEGGRDVIATAQQLRHGLTLDGERLLPAGVWWTSRRCDELRMVLRQGKYRQIRRMCEAVGLEVTGLHRDEIGGLKLEELGLQPGQWCVLSAEQRRALLG